jgi:hypothetical protein
MRQHEMRTVEGRRLGRFALRRGRRGSSHVVRDVGAGACALAVALGIGASPALAGPSTSSASSSLRAQAGRLYAPVRKYERSTTAAQRTQSHSAGRHVGKVIDACQAPYLKRLRKARLELLWDDAALLQTYQAEVHPVAKQLASLAASWASMSLRNRMLNAFVHAVATEFRATLNMTPFDSCGFVKAIAAHHFSDAWAKHSSYGLRAARWSREILRAGDRTNGFWEFVSPTPAGPGLPPPSPAGTSLFTENQLIVLSNLPGEIS